MLKKKARLRKSRAECRQFEVDYNKLSLAHEERLTGKIGEEELKDDM